MIFPAPASFAIWIAASYATGNDAVIAMTVAALVFLCSGLGSSIAWSAFGALIGKVLGSGLRLRIFNIAMAMLLLGSAIWLMATR